MTPIERRAAAVNATLERYRDRPFAWGKVDCAKIAAFHLKRLGHPIRISKAGSYSSALGAKRALGRLGFPDLPAMADAYLTRIPPARLLIGDIAQMEGDSPLGTICLYAGNGKLFGFHESHDALVAMEPSGIVAAWSAL